MLNALAISDLQIPFEHIDALDFCLHLKSVFFPDVEPIIINQGDEVDQYTMSNYAKNPKAMGAQHEFNEAKLRLKQWFHHFPKTFVCVSNHTYRVSKRAAEAGIPEGFLKTIGEAYEAPPGWQWKDRWIIEGVLFEHGENVSGPNAVRTAAMQNRMSTVIGHQHSNAGVVYIGSFNDVIYGMNTGCLIDVTQYAFDYGKTLRNKPTLGAGVIRNGVPYFVPMILNCSGRWVRYI